MGSFSHQISIAVKSAFRNFYKNWVYSSLNSIGLTIAYATLILVAIYLYQETTYEAFHEKATRIYRPTYHFSNASGYTIHFARIPVDYVNELPTEIPEIERLIRFQNKEQKYIRIGEERFKPQYAYSTDADVFDVFSFPFIAGNPKTALSKPHSVVLTVTVAKKYFGTADVLGRELVVTGDYSTDETIFRVTGVMQDIPVNTHLPVELLFSFDNEAVRTGWAYIYTLLAEDADLAAVDKKVKKFIASRSNPENTNLTDFRFQALPTIHLQSNLAREIKPNGQLSYIKIFFWVGLFVWLIALINFANLSAAMAMGRSKEIGVRKALGASTSNLAAFIIIETTTYSFIALFLGVLLAASVFPFFSHLTGVTLLPPNAYFIPFLVLIALVSGIIAGILPAFTASTLKTIQVIKQGKNWSRKQPSNGINFKRTMITLQFCATLVLLGGAFIAHQQFNYIEAKNLWIASEQTIAISSVPSKVVENYLTFKNRLNSVSGIRGVTACMQVPSSEIRDVGPVRIQGKTEENEQVPMMDMQIIDPDFVQLMGLQLVAGEDFTKNMVLEKPPVYTETLTPQRYLAEKPRHYFINETAMQQLGWSTPAEALGQNINWAIGGFQLPYGAVKGIIKDYHQESLKNKVDPLLLTVEPIWLSNILIKVETANLEATLSSIETIWNDLFPYALEYAFLDELFNKLYQQDNVQLQLLSILTAIAIFIAFLGLISLVAYALKTRSKELAIRRVIGANLTNLTLLIGKEYIGILLVATVLSIPISYFWTSKWLQNFAYRIDISPFAYLSAVVFIFGLLILTIYGQTYKATIENPIEALRED